MKRVGWRVKRLASRLWVLALMGASWAQGSLALERGPTAMFASSGMGDMDWIRQVPPVPRADIPTMVDGKRFPRIWLGSVRYEPSTKLTRYGLSDGLRSITRHTYNFQIIPQLRMPDGKVRELPDGYYLIRMAVLRPQLPELELKVASDTSVDAQAISLYDRFITSHERLIQVHQGTIRTEVTFDFPYASALNLRNTLLIQIVPVKSELIKLDARGLIRSDSHIVEVVQPEYTKDVIRVPFIPRYASGLATPVNPVMSDELTIEEELDLKSYIREARVFQSRLERTFEKGLSARNLALRLNARMIRETDVRKWSGQRTAFGVEVPRDFDLWATLEDGRNRISEEWAPALCSWLIEGAKVPQFLKAGQLGSNKERMIKIARQSEFVRCVARFESAVHLSRVILVKDFEHGYRDQKRGGNIRLTLSGNFLANRTSSIDTLHSLFGSASLLDLFGALRVTGNMTINHTQSRSQSEGSILSGATDLEVNFWELPIFIKESQVCLHVKPDASHLRLDPELKSLLICQDFKAQPLKVVERYFHVFPSPSTSPSIDPFDPRNQVVNMSLRGTRDYYDFLRSIISGLNPVHDREKTPVDELEKALQGFEGAIPALPGVISQTMTWEGKRSAVARQRRESPSFVDRVLFRYEEKL